MSLGGSAGRPAWSLHNLRKLRAIYEAFGEKRYLRRADLDAAVAYLGRREFLKVAAGSLATAVVLGLPGRAYGQGNTIQIDPSWSWQEIKALFRGESVRGNPPLSAGDTVYFLPGTYQQPLTSDIDHVRVQVSGTATQPVTIRGQDWSSTILRGYDPTGSFWWGIYGDHIVMEDFRMENIWAGPSVKSQEFGGVDYSDITFRRIWTVGADKHYSWDEQNSTEVQTSPAVKLENCYIEGGAIGMHYSDLGNTSLLTRYLGGTNLTLDGISGIGVDAPLADNNGTPVFLGNDDFFNTIIINTDAPFQEDLYFGMNSPRAFIEWQNGLPSLYARGIGEYNIEEDPQFDPDTRRPRNPHAYGPQYRDKQGRLIGYAGAVPPDGPVPFGGTRPLTGPRRHVRVRMP